MTNPQFAGHPFGTTVTAETLRNTFAPLTQWEDKYRQLIMLGKQLPALPEELKAAHCARPAGGVVDCR